jgi:hypothetical protein
MVQHSNAHDAFPPPLPHSEPLRRGARARDRRVCQPSPVRFATTEKTDCGPSPFRLVLAGSYKGGVNRPRTETGEY